MSIGGDLVPFFLQVDAPSKIFAFVKSWLPSRARAVRELPPGYSSADGGVVVLVDGDGTPGSGVATSRENVRVAVFGGTQQQVRRLASEIEARLLAHEATIGFHITPGAGLVVSRDKETKGWVAAITVICRSTKKGIF